MEGIDFAESSLALAKPRCAIASHRRDRRVALKPAGSYDLVICREGWSTSGVQVKRAVANMVRMTTTFI